MSGDRHVITENPTGPDLDDMVRLVRYLREHEVRYMLSVSVITDDGDGGEAWLDFDEGRPDPQVHSVDSEGDPYDFNGRAL